MDNITKDLQVVLQSAFLREREEFEGLVNDLILTDFYSRNDFENFDNAAEEPSTYFLPKSIDFAIKDVELWDKNSELLNILRIFAWLGITY